ncbi:hypothetical protein AK830_g11699 [Neonectria ditissima]|uniref:Uncharacterized protein n=1 Tax=Neonectria ditissima TaxID=78410 RepID=A0A0P7B7B0_9HYPO|nr:hypothetical protein AK830_g11699 [Neonectria ditissima]
MDSSDIELASRNGQCSLSSLSTVELQRSGKSTLVSPGNGKPGPATPSIETTALSKKIISFTTIIIHLVALGSTIAIVQLRLRRLYWADVADVTNDYNMKGYVPREEILYSLQFAAKMHEVIVVASLSAMLMHFVRRMLVGSGVPFGVMMGAHQVGSIQWLASLSFVDPIVRGSPRLRVRLFALLVGFVGLFANVVGPSSAIALLPTLDWWPAADPLAGPALITYIFRNSSTLFPQELIDPNPACLNGSLDTLQACPGAGFDALLSWSMAFSRGDSGRENITMSQKPVNAMRHLAARKPLDKAPGAAMATTITSSLLNVVGLLASSIEFTSMIWKQLGNSARVRLVTSDITPLYAPVVEVRCGAFDYFPSVTNTSNETVSFRSFDDTPPTHSSGISYPLSPELWNISSYPNSLHFKWSSIPGQPDLLGAVVLAPYVWPLGRYDAPDYSQESLIIPCTIRAWWAPVKLLLDHKTEKIVSSNISITDDDDPFWLNSTELGSRYSLSDPIHIDPRWAESLNTRFNKTNTNFELFGNVTAMEGLLLPWVAPRSEVPDASKVEDMWEFSAYQFETTIDDLGEYAALVKNAIAEVLGMALCDGLARAVPPPIASFPGSWDESSPFYWGQFSNGNESAEDELVYLVNQTDMDTADHSDAPGTWVVFEALRYGWGYNLESRSARVGVSILFVYLVMLFVYAAYYFIFMAGGRGWTSTAWTNMGDVVALALISRPPGGIRMSGVKFRKFQDWSMRLLVRERENEGVGGVQLFVAGEHNQERQDARRVRVGKKYE